MTDHTTERTSASVGLDAEPALAGEVVGHGLFRMSSGDVAGLRRKPGPIPEGWGPPPPSLLAKLGRANDCRALRRVHGDRAAWACRAIATKAGA